MTVWKNASSRTARGYHSNRGPTFVTVLAVTTVTSKFVSLVCVTANARVGEACSGKSRTGGWSPQRWNSREPWLWDQELPRALFR